MNQNDINRIVDELERRGHAPKYYPPEQKSGSWGFVLILIVFVLIGGFAIFFNQNDTNIQGNSNPVVIQPTQEYTITESEAVILATSTALVYPTNTAIPATPLPEIAPVATTANPMLQATLAGEWPRPITPQQYDWCVANPAINPVCEDYLK